MPGSIAKLHDTSLVLVASVTALSIADFARFVGTAIVGRGGGVVVRHRDLALLTRYEKLL